MNERSNRANKGEKKNETKQNEKRREVVEERGEQGNKDVTATAVLVVMATAVESR